MPWFLAVVAAACLSTTAIAAGGEVTPDPALAGQWCFLQLYLSAESISKICGLKHSTFDDVVNDGTARLEAFILGTSRNPPISAGDMKDYHNWAVNQFATYGPDDCAIAEKDWITGIRALPIEKIKEPFDVLTSPLAWVMTTGRVSCAI